jgi:chorismate dehydratase
MEHVRVGTVEYLNTAPLIAGLERTGGLTLVPAVPSRIIDLLLTDEVDIGLVSLIDVVRSAAALVVLPVGMIGCDGPTMTVRIFSKVPLERVTTLHADTDSHTSVALARVLLDRLHSVRPEIVDFHAREHPFGTGEAGGPETVLLIGDKVVTASPPAVRYPHQLDLGDAWHTLTGLPFVYAVWACKADRADDPEIQAAATLLDRNRRRNEARPDQIINKAAIEHRWPADLAREYAGSLLRFDLDERSQAAIGRFTGLCREIGVLQAEQPDPEIRDFVTTPG